MLKGVTLKFCSEGTGRNGRLLQRPMRPIHDPLQSIVELANLLWRNTLATMSKFAQSTFEWRHQAPEHFIAKSRNAYFNANLLRKVSTDVLQALAESEGYWGDPHIASSEGYIREIGVAMELAIKAVICRRIESGGHGENGLPHHHRLVDLWEHAALPELQPIECFQLFRLSVQIAWASRYPTSQRENDYNSTNARMRELAIAAHPPTQGSGRIKFLQAHGTDEAVLENLYEIAISAAARH